MDLRRCINLLSDVVNNRPMPIRELDQIYMKHADMLLQIEHISKYFSGKSVAFIGDGDAIALGLVYIQQNGEIPGEVKEIRVLDFDERIVNSINRFAASHKMADRISAELYNVANPLPTHLWGKFDCFYCNPPYGSSNDGASIIAFMKRGFEATGNGAEGCVVIADVPEVKWTGEVLARTQRYALDSGFIVSEMIPRFHTYHLDDNSQLTSCSIIFRRIKDKNNKYTSTRLDAELLENFYGKGKPLIFQQVKDINLGKILPKDYDLIPFGEAKKDDDK